MIRHISFDLWLTLIRSNPLFKRKRAELIADMYNPRGLNVSQIEMIIKGQDGIFNRYNEMKGAKIPAKEMYLNILKKISTDCRSVTEEHAECLIKHSDELFMEYPPALLNEQIPCILNKLKSENKTLSIGSNTGFVEGTVLRRMLKKLDLFHCFSFCIFSDEVKTSKPSASFFQRICDKAGISRSQILHIGDSLKADYRGATDFGFEALLITSMNYTLDDIRAKL
jgi:putative hydrolase of the HAD superfamily